MKLIRVADILILLALVCVSCSPINYRTFFDVSKDPTYDFKTHKTIGLAPVFWTVQGKAGNIDELKEKQFLLYMKTELEKRGFSVIYIDSDKLEEYDGRVALKQAALSGAMVGSTPEAAHRETKYPDLILTCDFGIQPETVKVPGEAFGRHDATGGYYSKTQSYEVKTYELSIACHLWSGIPEYKQKVWFARITQGSPLPDLADRAQKMITELFREKFPR